MKQPVVMVALRQASQLLVARRDIREQERSIAAMARSMRVLSERHTEVAAERDRWRSRAHALWLIADPERRDAVVGVLSTIDDLPVVDGPPRSAPT